MRTNNRGDVSLYISLIVVSVMLGLTLILSTVLARQVRLTATLVASERAFYGANSGLEATLFNLSKQFAVTTEVEGVIEYENDEVAFQGAGQTVDNETGAVCVRAIGSYRGQQRRLALGPADCETGN